MDKTKLMMQGFTHDCVCLWSHILKDENTQTWTPLSAPVEYVLQIRSLFSRWNGSLLLSENNIEIASSLPLQDSVWVSPGCSYTLPFIPFHQKSHNSLLYEQLKVKPPQYKIFFLMRELILQ